MFNRLQIERTETDWLICRVEDQTFMGSGGVFNLDEIIEIIKNWVASIK
ncbi:Imm53 family immunity protein [Paenibacillus silvestris]